MKRKGPVLRIRTLLALLLVASLLVLVVPAQAASVTPIFVEGNPTCVGLGYDYGFKVDPPDSGTYPVPSFGTITVTADGIYFDWTSTFGISAVIAKGGPNANLYVYNPPAYSYGDTGLHSPINPSTGQPYGLSHIEFCYDEGAMPQEALTVTKTVETSFTRTWEWTIDKAVDPEEWDLFLGDTGTSEYTVEVAKTGYTDSAWTVFGNITIENTGQVAANITGVDDVVSPSIAATVDCGVTFPYILPVGGTLICTYSAALPDGSTRLNTATAYTTAWPAGYYDQKDVIFGDPTTVVNDSINVTDTNGQSWGPVSANTTWTYTKTFGCPTDPAEYTCGTVHSYSHDNTATITETGQFGNASVQVTCYLLKVQKDAATSLTRTWDWEIDKVGDQTELTLSPGQQSLVNYDVTVGANSTDSDWAVYGNITVNNPAPIPAVINSVADAITPAIAATVDCGVTFPYTLAAGGTLICSYIADLPDAQTRANSATATLQNYDYDSAGNATASGTTAFYASADVDFGNATVTEVDECIEVTDSIYGPLGTICADNAPYTFEYSMYVGPYEECGVYNFVNIASFVTNDTGATGSDDWTVTITVPCPGCTLTPGYWKTHSKYGPAPYDDTWALLGEDTIFFLSGKTYYQVLWTPPSGGNAYYILAHAYIAARLNQLNGADFTDAQAAFDEATTLFSTYAPAQIGALKGNSSLRKLFISLADTLDKYNNGIIGPGHCDEECNGMCF